MTESYTLFSAITRRTEARYVTITDADRETFQTTVEEFRPQITEDMCLPTALKNVLDEFADRHSSDSPLSLSDINDICDYRAGGASTSRNVPAKLDPEIEDYGIETKIMFNATFEDLEAIIDDNDRSLPIVELDSVYFESVDGYDPRGGVDGYQWDHVVIPFTVNDETVLFYDPFEEIFQRSTRIDTPPTQRSKTQFYEWWTAASSRWTMWLQRSDQQVLTNPQFRQEDEE
jgi:hypothetical protein